MIRFRSSINGALLAGLFALTGCQPPVMHVRAKAISPDRSKIAIVLEEDPLPPVATDTVVLVRPIGRKSDEKVDAVFRGGDMNGRHFGPVNIRWLRDDALWVGYCSGQTSVYRNHWLDSHASDPREIEVVLEHEAPGQWPPSGPPNGQSGPPPCP